MRIPKPLLDNIASGKCLPFVGAGFSLNSKVLENRQMPDWQALTETLAEAAEVEVNIGPPRVASRYERKFGRVQLIETIRQALHPDHSEPGRAHRAFAQLPFETVYTTNFDLLLEEAYSSIKKPYRSIAGELQMPFHGGPFTTTIVKMHGDLRHEEHIIVTQEDYDSYLNNYPVIATHLSAMLITNTPLFIGYSLSDINFRQIREVVRSRLGRFHRMAYIIQFNQTDDHVESMFSENLHVVNLITDREESKGDKLAQFFEAIQEQLDVSIGEQFRSAKPELFEPISPEIFEEASRSKDASTLLASSSNFCFILMPFRQQFDSIFADVIQPVVEDFGLQGLRADQIFAPGSIMEQIRSAIRQARICIADITDQNPNVMYELGIAQTVGKPTILMTQDIEYVPFDLRSHRFIVYNPHKLEEARNHLTNAIRNLLGEDRLGEARRLIDNGMTRAAVAILGVLLEQGLRQLVLKHPNKPAAKNQSGRRIGMSRMLESLVSAGVIDQQDASKLAESINIRNSAVHELQEPSTQDALLMLYQVQSFLEQHRLEDFG